MIKGLPNKKIHINKTHGAPLVYKKVPLRVILPLKRGMLHTYQIYQSYYMYPSRGCVVIDCGFNTFREVPVRPGIRFKKGEIVLLKRTTKGFRLKRIKASYSVLYTYKAYLERIIDGNTILVSIDCGFGTWVRQPLRFRGINAPPLTTQKGKNTKRFIEKALKLRHFIIIKTYLSDKYDQFLVDVFYTPGEADQDKVAQEGRFLNQELLDNKLVTPMVW